MLAKRYVKKRAAIGYELPGSWVMWERVGSVIAGSGNGKVALTHKQARIVMQWLAIAANDAEAAKRGAKR